MTKEIHTISLTLQIIRNTAFQLLRLCTLWNLDLLRKCARLLYPICILRKTNCITDITYPCYLTLHIMKKKEKKNVSQVSNFTHNERRHFPPISHNERETLFPSKRKYTANNTPCNASNKAHVQVT